MLGRTIAASPSSLYCSCSTPIASSSHDDDNEEEEDTTEKDEPTEEEIRREVHLIWQEKQIHRKRISKIDKKEAIENHTRKRVANYFIRFITYYRLK